MAWALNKKDAQRIAKQIEEANKKYGKELKKGKEEEREFTYAIDKKDAERLAKEVEEIKKKYEREDKEKTKD